MDKAWNYFRRAGTALCVFLLLGLQSIYIHAAREENSGISSIQIQSGLLGEERTVSVVLPDGYEKNDSHYPVLYTLDAEQAPSFSKDCSSVADLTREGKMPPVIIVGIWNAEGMRNRDMIPVSMPHRPGSGGSKLFLEFIEKELMIHIKSTFRASDRSYLYGASNAGLFALYALLSKPELFEACIAASPMIGHCSDFMNTLAADFVKRNPIKKRIIYMIYGTEDSPRVTNFVPDYQKFLENNAPGGFKSHHVIIEGEGHVPAGSLEKGLRAIFSENIS